MPRRRPRSRLASPALHAVALLVLTLLPGVWTAHSTQAQAPVAFASALDVAIQGSHAYVAAGEGGLRLLDVSDPRQPRELAALPLEGYATQVRVAGSYVYVLAAAVEIVDVADPARPRRVGRAGFGTGRIAVAGDVLFQTQAIVGPRGPSAYCLTDLTDRAKPKALGCRQTPGERPPGDVAVVGRYLYVTLGAYANERKSQIRVLIVDVSNPAQPVERGTFVGLLGSAGHIAVQGNLAYVTASQPGQSRSGLVILDLSDPLQPVQIGTHSQLASDAVASGSYVYTFAGRTFDVVDVSNPLRPRGVGTFTADWDVRGLAVTGSYVYLAASFPGVRVLDVSDPSRPREVGYYSPTSLVYLPAVTSTSGLQVLNRSTATANVRFVNRPIGTGGAVERHDTIPPLGSRTYLGDALPVPEDFAGSVQILADQPVAAIANLVPVSSLVPGEAPRLESYVGVTFDFSATRPAPTQYLPLVLREHGGFTTQLHVANVGAFATRDVVVELYRGADLVATRRLAVDALGTAQILDLATVAELGAAFVGSARVTAGQPVAVLATHGDGAALLGSPGFSAGAATLHAPLVASDRGGWTTGLRVQNVGANPTTVELLVDGQVTDRQVLDPLTATTWFPVLGVAPSSAGAAVIRSTDGGQLVGVANHLESTTGQGLGYPLFTTGSATVDLPLIMAQHGGFDSGVQVQNTGPATTTATLHLNGVPAATVTLAPGRSHPWYPIPGAPPGFVGSATLTASPGGQIVALVIQISASQRPGDTAAAFPGLNR